MTMFPLVRQNASDQIRILYVEDHADTLELVTIVLKAHGYEVTTANSIESAWQLLREEKYDFYLLDSWLSDGSGLELCKRIREVDSETPVLFYSAAAYEVDRDSAIAAGAQGYLVKPASLSELCDLVARLIRPNELHLSRGKGSLH